jgi:AcrR family transcriptional regulator
MQIHVSIFPAAPAGLKPASGIYYEHRSYINMERRSSNPRRPYNERHMNNPKATQKAQREPRKPARVRGRARAMSHADIVDATLDIILKEGYSNLSMRSIAARLKTGAATLYNYFPSQRDVEEAVVEKMLLGIKPPDSASAAQLRQQLVDMALTYRNLILQFPQFYEIASHTPGWTALRLLNATLRVVVGAGVPVERAGLAWTLLAGMAQFHAMAMLQHRDFDPRKVRTQMVKELPAQDFDMIHAYLASPTFKGSVDDAFRRKVEMAIDHLMPELGQAKAGRKPGIARK